MADDLLLTVMEIGSELGLRTPGSKLRTKWRQPDGVFNLALPSPRWYRLILSTDRIRAFESRDVLCDTDQNAAIAMNLRLLTEATVEFVLLMGAALIRHSSSCFMSVSAK